MFLNAKDDHTIEKIKKDNFLWNSDSDISERLGRVCYNSMPIQDLQEKESVHGQLDPYGHYCNDWIAPAENQTSSLRHKKGAGVEIRAIALMERILAAHSSSCELMMTTAVIQPHHCYGEVIT